MSEGRILVTDDDTQSRKIITAYLDYKGYEVKEACDAEQALEIIKSQEIDLVITDLMMPKCNGLDFLIKSEKHPSPGGGNRLQRVREHGHEVEIAQIRGLFLL